MFVFGAACAAAACATSSPSEQGSSDQERARVTPPVNLVVRGIQGEDEVRLRGKGPMVQILEETPREPKDQLQFSVTGDNDGNTLVLGLFVQGDRGRGLDSLLGEFVLDPEAYDGNQNQVAAVIDGVEYRSRSGTATMERAGESAAGRFEAELAPAVGVGMGPGLFTDSGAPTLSVTGEFSGPLAVSCFVNSDAGNGIVDAGEGIVGIRVPAGPEHPVCQAYQP
jgi:hypothetical protein